MSAIEKIDQLVTQIKNNNYQLMDQVRTLKPADQKKYSEKVSKLIDRTQKTVSTLNKKG